ncbi:MAG: long-chain-fatty-acyl-CoA reductase [Porticoccaceae bacterium]|nr:MAG: long-chain-fatty-acyl-CoA reductase [Porticoccaceae bacterium]
MAETPILPAVIRGEAVAEPLIPFGGRGGELTFLAPDPRAIADRLPLSSPRLLADLHALRLDEILDFLEEAGKRLHLDRNPYLAEALEWSVHTAPTTRPILEGFYRTLPAMFQRERILTWIEHTLGREPLEGWVAHRIGPYSFEVRAYGSRAVHIVAGNGPTLGALTILRGAVTRSDTLIKVPSNDPFTTVAIARTLLEIDPRHPVVRHLAVAYWKGGDQAVEERLYRPACLDKICAWGGFASVKHVTRYLRPGLELIALDPKYSVGVVGPGCLADDDAIAEVARRIACDVAVGNQVGCANSRKVYVVDGVDEAALARLVRLGHAVYREMLALPETLSTRPKRYDPELAAHLEACRLLDGYYTVIGGEAGEGAVVVSHSPEAVDFADLLADRTVNLIPVERLEDFLAEVDQSTQTIGVWPPAWLEEVSHWGALAGGQRFVELGWHLQGPGLVGPQDGIEPVRRLVRWIVRERPSPEARPLWALDPDELKLLA